MEDSMLQSSFKAEFTFERRAEVAAKILDKYSDRVPVIAERAQNAAADVPECAKRKFLVPRNITLGNFLVEIRRHMVGLDPIKSLHLFVCNTSPPLSLMMSELYERHKDDDGFLYVTYSGENTFG